MTAIRLVLMIALALASRRVDADPTRDAATHYRQGVAYEKAGAFDQAIDEYKQAFAHDKKPDHLFNIGRVYEQKGELQLAIDHYDKFLAADPNNAHAKDARLALAVATKKLADQVAAKKAADEAAEAERKRLETDKERVRVAAEAHLKQAVELERRNAWAAAAEEYLRATILDGDQEHVLTAAEAYRKQPDLAKAKATLQSYLDKLPNGPRSDEVRVKVADLARELQEAEAAAKARADADAKAAAEAKLKAESSRPIIVAPNPTSGPGPHARGRSRGWKFAFAGLGFGAVSGVFAYLGRQATDDIEKGSSRTGGEIADKITNGRLYNYLSYGAVAVGVVGVVIGGITIGIHLNDDSTASPQVGLAVKGAL